MRQHVSRTSAPVNASVGVQVPIFVNKSVQLVPALVLEVPVQVLHELGRHLLIDEDGLKQRWELQLYIQQFSKRLATLAVERRDTGKAALNAARYSREPEGKSVAFVAQRKYAASISRGGGCNSR